MSLNTKLSNEQLKINQLNVGISHYLQENIQNNLKVIPTIKYIK